VAIVPVGVVQLGLEATGAPALSVLTGTQGPRDCWPGGRLAGPVWSCCPRLPPAGHYGNSHTWLGSNKKVAEPSCSPHLRSPLATFLRPSGYSGSPSSCCLPIPTFPEMKQPSSLPTGSSHWERHRARRPRGQAGKEPPALPRNRTAHHVNWPATPVNPSTATLCYRPGSTFTPGSTVGPLGPDGDKGKGLQLEAQLF
jgi:hypothetical protein